MSDSKDTGSLFYHVKLQMPGRGATRIWQLSRGQRSDENSWVFLPPLCMMICSKGAWGCLRDHLPLSWRSPSAEGQPGTRTRVKHAHVRRRDTAQEAKEWGALGFVLQEFIGGGCPSLGRTQLHTASSDPHGWY